MMIFRSVLATAVGLSMAVGAARAEMRPDVSFVLTTTAVTPGHSTVSSLQQKPGFWKQEGLNVRVLPVEGSTTAVQQVASGNADVASVGPEVLLSARERGVPIKAFYMIVPKTIYRVLAPADSAIRSPADLKGTTIGVPSVASASYPFARSLVSSAGLNPDTDVKWLAVGVGAQAALALQRGQVQALSIWDTMKASLEGRGMKFTLITAPYQDKLIGQVLVAREDFLEKHPESAIALARGIAEATVFAVAHPDETVHNHWRIYPQSKPQQGSDAEKLADARRELDARVGPMEVKDWPATPYGRIDPERWDATVQAALKEGQITSADKVQTAYTNEFIPKINDFDKAKVLANQIAE